MVDADTPQKQFSDLTALQQKGLDTFLEALSDVTADEVLDDSYKSGVTHDFRSDIAEEVGCSVDTVTRSITESPRVTLWRASDAGLAQSTIDELRQQLTDDAGDNVLDGSGTESVNSDTGSDGVREPVGAWPMRERRRGDFSPGRHPRTHEDRNQQVVFTRLAVLFGVVVACLYLLQRGIKALRR